MKLADARVVFAGFRSDRKFVVVLEHAYKAHPERLFTRAELITLIMQAKGLLNLNLYPTAIEGSFLFICRDDQNRNVEIAVLIEDKIIAVHAFRRIK